jgi:hypothetical protein
MSDNKKELEYAELHMAIWIIADDLRGSVDGWDFKTECLGYAVLIKKNVLACVGIDLCDFSEKKHPKKGDHFGVVTEKVLACMGVGLW